MNNFLRNIGGSLLVCMIILIMGDFFYCPSHSDPDIFKSIIYWVIFWASISIYNAIRGLK